VDPANLSSVLVSVGCNYQILPTVHVEGGLVFGGSMGFNMPAGVLISLVDGFWEFGVSTRDLLTIIIDKNPTISLSAALCRLRF
jgi:hypothetical protein